MHGLIISSYYVPTRHSVQVLQHLATGNELEQERLAYFATAEGRDDLYRHVQLQTKRTIGVGGRGEDVEADLTTKNQAE